MSFTLCPICGQRNDTTGHTCWVQTIAPTAWNNHIDIRTDNTDVIRALEKRVGELEAEIKRLREAGATIISAIRFGLSQDELEAMEEFESLLGGGEK